MQKKNLILPPPHLEIASEAAEGAGSADHRDDEPDGCRCEMSVDSVSGAGVVEDDYWRIQDQSGSGSFQIFGSENTYLPLTGPPYLPLPSDFRTLNSPSNGNHVFWLTFIYETPSIDPLDLVLFTKVKCYTIVDNVVTLATTTNHRFAMDEGDLVFNLPGVYAVEICKKFSCEVLTQAESNCYAILG